MLIVAHANTIRALVKSMDNISDEHIAKLKIPNGIPLGQYMCICMIVCVYGSVLRCCVYSL